MNTDKSSKVSMHVFALVAVFFWALAYVLTRVVVQHFSSEAAAFWRYFVAALAIFIYAAATKMRLPKLRDVPFFLLGGAAGFAVYVYGINMGSKTLTAAVVSFVISASPIITALLARVFLKEKVGLIGWASVLCAFAGIGIITYYSGGFTFGSGVVWICGCAVLISVYNILQRKLLVRYTPLEITTYCIIAGSLMLFVFAPQSLPQIVSASPVQILSIVILGVFSADVAYLSWTFALSKAEKTAQVTNYMFLTPIVTILLGLLILGEVPHPSAYAGGVLVLAGVLLVNIRHSVGKRGKQL